MKREFLQNFKVGDQPLSKEVIDAIMEENGRDIESAKKPYADYDTMKTQLEEAQKTIKSLQDQDIEGVRKSAKEWEEKYNQAIAQQEEAAFNGKIKDAITGMKGKSEKAIRALLDTEALKSSKNQDADIKTALETVKKENAYLFDDEGAPPPYSGGSGSGGKQPSGEPTNLADALRARYNMN